MRPLKGSLLLVEAVPPIKRLGLRRRDAAGVRPLVNRAWALTHGVHGLGSRLRKEKKDEERPTQDEIVFPGLLL